MVRFNVAIMACCLAGADAMAQPPAEVVRPGLVSQLDRYEFRAAIDPVSDEIWYSYYEPQRYYGIGIASDDESRVIDEVWPGQFGQFAGEAVLEPQFGPRGDVLVFNSNRTTANRDVFDLWSARRRNSGWDNPRRFEAPINSDAAEWFPSLVESGRLYFGSERAGGAGGIDLYVADEALSDTPRVRRLPAPVNSPAQDFDAYVDPRERFMIFISDRSGGFGGSDLYIALPDAAGAWAEVHLVGAPYNDGGSAIGAPMVDLEGRYLMGSSNRGAPDLRGDILRWPLGDVFAAAGLDLDAVLGEP